ncbi:MAG: hypothetical protein WC755_05565 [Candidatus Woesearchaeota archaeon]|jgi:hypothetical protein
MSEISDIVKISVACAAMVACAPEVRNVFSNYAYKLKEGVKEFINDYKSISNIMYK